ncbi:hypothetical protein CAEBREN_21463 [Caenorhabditis brenneri]|uniref:Uncharacterized protein n=1 Tax=Caenorhabditis brenneri TaxID=135651 RepID=G0PBG9_CAEBE|nr:hypothetical protein CAEBREN_21463 [Caenorhabditis brenneri]
MASKIEIAAQDEPEIDPLWRKAVDPDFTGQKCLAKLVANVIRQARKDPSRFSSMKKVCQRIFSDMELEKEIFNFVIEDLRCEFRNVANLFECEVSKVKNEFARLFAELEAAELKAAELKAEASKAPKPSPTEWEDYTADTTRSIVKSQNYRRKNARIHFRRSQILDDLVFKEVNFAMGLYDKKGILTRKRTVIDRILKNLKGDGFMIEDLEEWHYRKVAKFYRCQRSLVREEFLRQKDELVIKKEDEHILDLLVPNVCKLMDKSSYQSNEEILRLLCLNLEVYGQKTSDLKHRDWTQLSKHWDKTEIEEEFHRMFAEFKEIKRESRYSLTPPSTPEFLRPEDQENHEQGPPVTKKLKLALEPEFEEVEDKDSELEEEYQDGYYDDHMGYEEEYHDPQLQDPNIRREDGPSWDYVDGIPAPRMDEEDPALSEYEEEDLQEMEQEEEYEEAPELQDPNEPSWEYMDGVPGAVDEDPEPEGMVVVQEDEQVARVEQEDELQDVRDFFIGSICQHAEKYFDNQTPLDFKKKTSLRWVFNRLADQGFPLELTDEQFENVAKSFNCDRDDIESVFDFYKKEKEFLDKLDEGRPEDQRITDIYNGIVAEMKPLSGHHDYQNKFLESFYRKAVENNNKLVLNSRQKRKLAAHLGLTVTEIMEHLKKWLIRDLPKPATEKRMPEKQIRSSSVEIAREEQFWGSLAELEPTETIADREAAVEIVEEERKKIEEYILKYRKQVALPYQPEYTSVLSKVVEQFGRANNHATKWMPPPVLEAYRTAFLTILYEEIERELNEKEADEVARFLKMKNFDYLRRKENQLFETRRIELDKVD